MVTIREVYDRVYAGRSVLYNLGCDPRLKNVEILISPDIWANLLAEYEQELEAQNRLYLYIAASLEDPLAPTEFKIFGLTARCANDLGRGEIRFRSEVSL